MSGHSPTGRSLILVEIGLSLYRFRPTFVNNLFEFQEQAVRYTDRCRQSYQRMG